MHILRLRKFAATLGIVSLLAPSLAHAADGYFYITNYTDGTVSVVSSATKQVQETIDLDFGAHAIAINGTGAYVVNAAEGDVTIIDVTDNEIVTTVSVGSSPQDIAFNGTGAYVVNTAGDTISIIDTTDFQVVTTGNVGDGPRGIAISGTGVYVANGNANTLAVVDRTDNQVVTTVALGDPFLLAISGTGIYVSNFNSNTVSIVDLTDNQVVTTVNVGTGPRGIAFNGTGAYVANNTADTVSIIDITDFQVVTTVSVGDTPERILINGTGAYVTNSGDDTVSIVDIANNAVEMTISVGDLPRGIAFYEDTATLAPTLTAPTSGASVQLCNDLTITYSLPETPQSGTVKLKFFNSGTSQTVTATLTNSTGATFSLDLENFTGVANVSSSTANSIVTGSYVVTLEYQDQFGNAVADDTANLTVTSCASSSSSSSATTTQSGGGGGVRQVTLEMKQKAAEQRFGAASSSSVITSSSSAVSGYFKDVPLAAWFYNFVEQLRLRNVVSGYRNAAGEDTKMFGPADNVTYGQLAKMIATLTNKTPSSMDAKLHWAEPYVREARKNRLSVFANTSLNLDTPATRGAVVRTILEAYGISLDALPQNTFEDLPATHAYAKDILTALTLGIISGDDNGNTVRPNDPINRAELSKILITVSKRFSPKPVAAASSSIMSKQATSAAAQLSSAKADKNLRHVTTAILNVRSDARINSTILWVARQGQEFEVLRTIDDDWAHVRVTDGNEGYVWIHHLSK